MRRGLGATAKKVKGEKRVSIGVWSEYIRSERCVGEVGERRERRKSRRRAERKLSSIPLPSFSSHRFLSLISTLPPSTESSVS